MKVLLVDPFQRKIHPLESENADLNQWHKWCDCDCFDHAHLGDYEGLRHDAFVDDEGLLKNPVSPLWQWRNYPNPLPGYGIITACDSLGATVPVTMPIEFAISNIAWELWEERLNVENYFDQLSRIYP
jgi:hypothetical protein